MRTLLGLAFSGPALATAAFPAETLYNGIRANAAELDISAVAYGNSLLSVHQMHLGPRNSICNLGSFLKITRPALAAKPL